MSEKLNTNALFLGSKAENSEIFEKMLLEAFRDHVFWRRNFHPEDPLFLTNTEKRSVGYENTVDAFQTRFYELLSRLKNSVPFHSPRYIGHMAADILMPGIIGYFSTMLYNPNNVSYEASPVTSEMEIEVGRELAALAGFDSAKSWAHLTSGGTVANIEALWVIRNLVYFPLVAREIVNKYNKSLKITLPDEKTVDIKDINDDYTLLSLTPESHSSLANDFFGLDWDVNIQDEVYKHKKNISHSGMQNVPVGKVLVPASKHYSWPKAAEILGIGRSNIEPVKVDSNFRTDINDLKEKLIRLYNEKIPVLAVIGIVGTTECGSVDSIHRIVELREWYERECNSSFYIHIDAAYGGYPRSIFIEEDNKTFRPLDDIRAGFLHNQHIKWPTDDVYNAYKAMGEVDSITVDPHKLGYIPYPAGAVIYRDKRVKPATLCKAPYINNTTKADDEDAYIGGYILEGSKPGAAAAACWLAHKVVPLNKNGYGKIISEPIDNAHMLYDIFTEKNPVEINVNGKKEFVDIKILNEPDLDILLYIFNIRGNKSLAKMNRLNALIIEEFSYKLDKVVAAHEFIVSSTDFTPDIYGNSVEQALIELGINLDDWYSGDHGLKVIRSSVVTTLVNREDLRKFYWNNFVDSILTALEKIINMEEL